MSCPVCGPNFIGKCSHGSQSKVIEKRHMTRKEQIREQAKHEDSDGYFGFISGAEWADDHQDDLHEHYQNLIEPLNSQLKIAIMEIEKIANGEHEGEATVYAQKTLEKLYNAGPHWSIKP